MTHQPLSSGPASWWISPAGSCVLSSSSFHGFLRLEPDVDERSGRGGVAEGDEDPVETADEVPVRSQAVVLRITLDASDHRSRTSRRASSAFGTAGRPAPVSGGGAG
jgi:hypothetical protein